MVKYSTEPKNASKSCKAQGSDLRVHFKNTLNAANALRGRTLLDAQRYLEDVMEKKRCIPWRRFTGGIGQNPQAKEFKLDQGRWPVKSCKVLLGLLKNAEANAEFKNLDTENLIIKHVQVHEAQNGRRRTYRAHGRMGAYMSCPCHVQMILEEKEEPVEKPQEDSKPKKFTKKQLAIRRLKAGGGVRSEEHTSELQSPI